MQAVALEHWKRRLQTRNLPLGEDVPVYLVQVERERFFAIAIESGDGFNAQRPRAAEAGEI